MPFAFQHSSLLFCDSMSHCFLRVGSRGECLFFMAPEKRARCRYDARAFSGVQGKIRGSPVVLGSLLLLLTVIRQRLLYSVEQDENRHVLYRNTLIFPSLPFRALLLPLSQSWTISWDIGLWDLKTYISSARQNWISLFFCAVLQS